jgi:dienelactone hydrolase
VIGLLFASYVVAKNWYAAEQWFVTPRGTPARPSDFAGLRDVQFRTVDGVTLHGWFHPSANGAAVVLSHAIMQDRSGLLPEARVLAGAGYGVLVYDSRGSGASDGRLTLGYQEQRDLESALQFARSQPGVDPRRVGAMGFSMGAVTLAEVAARDPELRAVVLLSPFPSLRKRLALDFGSWGPVSTLGALIAAWRHGVDLNAVQAEKALPRLAPRTPLVIVGATERAHEMSEIEAALPPGSSMWRVPGAGHGGFIDAAPEAYPARLLAHFEAVLGP